MKELFSGSLVGYIVVPSIIIELDCMECAVCIMKAFSFPCDVGIDLVLGVVVQYWLYTEVPAISGCMEDWFGQLKLFSIACVLGNKTDDRTVVSYFADKEAVTITDGIANIVFVTDLFSICLVVRKEADVVKFSVAAEVLYNVAKVLGSIFGLAVINLFPLKYIAFSLFTNISLEAPYKSQTKPWTM